MAVARQRQEVTGAKQLMPVPEAPNRAVSSLIFLRSGSTARLDALPLDARAPGHVLARLDVGARGRGFARTLHRAHALPGRYFYIGCASKPGRVLPTPARGYSSADGVLLAGHVDGYGLTQWASQHADAGRRRHHWRRIPGGNVPRAARAPKFSRRGDDCCLDHCGQLWREISSLRLANDLVFKDLFTQRSAERQSIKDTYKGAYQKSSAEVTE